MDVPLIERKSSGPIVIDTGIRQYQLVLHLTYTYRYILNSSNEGIAFWPVLVLCTDTVS